MNNSFSFLGSGWSFPPVFFKGGEKLEMLNDYDDIASSLYILLGTATGERIMQPDYGCNLDELVFESLDATMKTYLKDKIAAAILYHEPRITLHDVVFRNEQETEGVILIEIVYVVRATNSRMNMVYPYYINDINK